MPHAPFPSADQSLAQRPSRGPAGARARTETAAKAHAPGRTARPRSRARRLVALAFVAYVFAGLHACVQPTAVFEPFTVVNIQIAGPPQNTIAGVRVSLSGTRHTATGTGATAGDNDFAFTDTTGTAQIRTQSLGRHFVVARHQNFDLTYGGDFATVLFPGSISDTAFVRGRLNVDNLDGTFTCNFLYPFSGFPDPNLRPRQRSPRQLQMLPKTKGVAYFVAFAEDFNLLRNSFLPTNKPQAVGRISVVGDFNNFVTDDGDPVNPPLEMFDDGSQNPINDAGDLSGDYNTGDGVFTRAVHLTPGIHTYMFIANGVNIYTRDPYEELSKPVKIALPRNRLNNEQDILDTRASAILVE